MFKSQKQKHRKNLASECVCAFRGVHTKDTNYPARQFLDQKTSKIKNEIWFTAIAEKARRINETNSQFYGTHRILVSAVIGRATQLVDTISHSKKVLVYLTSNHLSRLSNKCSSSSSSSSSSVVVIQAKVRWRQIDRDTFFVLLAQLASQPLYTL